MREISERPELWARVLEVARGVCESDRDSLSYPQVREILKLSGILESICQHFSGQVPLEDIEQRVTDKLWFSVNPDGHPFIAADALARAFKAVDVAHRSDLVSESSAHEFQSVGSANQVTFVKAEEEYTGEVPNDMSLPVTPKVDPSRFPNQTSFCSLSHHQGPARIPAQIVVPSSSSSLPESRPNIDLPPPEVLQSLQNYRQERLRQLQAQILQTLSENESPLAQSKTAGNESIVIEARKRKDIDISAISAHSITNCEVRNRSNSESRMWELAKRQSPSTSVASTGAFSFRPELDKKSRLIDSKRMKQEDAGDRLCGWAKRQQDTQKKLENEKKELEAKELAECTFRPSINKYSQKIPRDATAITKPTICVQNHYHPQGSESDALAADCTFRPAVSRTPLYEKNKATAGVDLQRQIAGFADYVRRQKLAKQEKENRNVCEQNVREGRRAHDANGPSSRRIRQTTCSPFSFQLDHRQRNKPILTIDVNFGTGRAGRLGVHEGDTPQALAVSFAAAHQLSASQTCWLEQLLVEHMKEVKSTSTAHTTRLVPSSEGNRSIASKCSNSSTDFTPPTSRASSALARRDLNVTR